MAVVGELDGHVPNYNMFGQQHHRLPTKDKGHFAKIAKEKPEWTKTPRYRTQKEMFAARRAAQRPDLSYDFDGDGSVGNTDYLIGKQFSATHDSMKSAETREALMLRPDFLTSAERQNAVQALENGFLDAYSFGHDHFGAKRPFPMKQIRGKIISVDNIGELSEVYPPHWNADKQPRFKTATEMKHHRRAELINAGDKLRAAEDAKSPWMVPEPPVPRDPPPPAYGMSSSARRDAKRREAREYAGLDSDNSCMNPSRELQLGTSIEYKEQPTYKSRTEMKEKKRKELLQESAETRRQGELDYVPQGARYTARNAVAYEERRGNAEAQTMTKLAHQRKIEKIEHNMQNFGVKADEVPRYGEQEHAWWTLQTGYVHEPTSCTLSQMKEPKKDITEKVNLICPTQRARAAAAPSASISDDRPPSNTENELGHQAHFDEAEHRTLNRWTTEFQPQGIAERAPRYFDGVKQAATYSMDTADLDQFSSFDCIANNSIMKGTARQRQTAKEDEERAHSWKLSVRGLPDPNEKSDDFDSGVWLEGTGGSTTLSVGVSVQSVQKELPTQKRGVLRIPERRANRGQPMQITDSLAEDVPMTQRLERIITGRHQLDTVSENRSPSATGQLLQDGSRRSLGRGHTLQPDHQGIKSGDRTSRAPSQAKAAPSVAAPNSARGPRDLVVRSSGFQWIESQHAVQPHAEDALSRRTNSSLMRNMQPSQDTPPPRSRSVSRTLSKGNSNRASTEALGNSNRAPLALDE